MLRTISIAVISGLLVGGCQVPTPSPVGPAAVRSPAPQPEPARAVVYTGRVLGLDGKPAPEVRVVGYELVSIGKLIGNTGAAVVSSNGGSIVANNGANWRLLQASGLETRTDAGGRFTIRHPEGEPLNIEAVLREDVKAIMLDVAADAEGVTLQLAPTGTIRGRVTAPDAPGVTNFEGVDVFIPGTGYLAKSAQDGSYTLPNVPAGSFSLVASKEGLGRASVQAVAVASKTTVQAADLALSLIRPKVTSVSPANGGPGASVTIEGEHFGASSGATFQVSFGGTITAEPQRADDGMITATVPAGASAGDVIVSVSGIASAPASFQVIKELSLSPVVRDLVMGQPHPYTVQAKDTAGQPVASPAVTWQVDGTAFAVSATGLVTPKSVGEATLRAASGSVVTSLAVEVLQALPTVSDVAGTGVPGFESGPRAAAQFKYPHDVAVDQAGNLYVSDWGNHAVRKIATDGTVSTLAGDGSPGDALGTGTAARFEEPIGIAVGPAGLIHLADAGNHRLCRIGPAGEVLSIVQGMGLQGVALDAEGNWYIADFGGHRVHKLTPAGALSVVAGSGVAGGADGKGAAAQFNGPRDVAVDSLGHLYVTEWNGHRVRKIAPDGTVTTLGGNGSPGRADGPAAEARFNQPACLVVDGSGNVYVADRSNHRICKITPSGIVKTVAGTGAPGQANGSAPEAQFAGPNGLGIDEDGDLYVADTGNHRIRKIAF